MLLLMLISMILLAAIFAITLSLISSFRLPLDIDADFHFLHITFFRCCHWYAFIAAQRFHAPCFFAFLSFSPFSSAYFRCFSSLSMMVAADWFSMSLFCHAFADIMSLFCATPCWWRRFSFFHYYASRPLLIFSLFRWFLFADFLHFFAVDAFRFSLLLRYAVAAYCFHAISFAVARRFRHFSFCNMPLIYWFHYYYFRCRHRFAAFLRLFRAFAYAAISMPLRRFFTPLRAIIFFWCRRCHFRCLPPQLFRFSLCCLLLMLTLATPPLLMLMMLRHFRRFSLTPPCWY